MASQRAEDVAARMRARARGRVWAEWVKFEQKNISTTREALGYGLWTTATTGTRANGAMMYSVPYITVFHTSLCYDVSSRRHVALHVSPGWKPNFVKEDASMGVSQIRQKRKRTRLIIAFARFHRRFQLSRARVRGIAISVYTRGAFRCA